MIPVRPGILYAIPELVNLVEKHKLDRDELIHAFPSLGEIECGIILDTAVSADWIAEDRNGRLVVTKRGAEISQIPNQGVAMRVQLQDVVIKGRPKWASRLLLGRSELAKLGEEDVLQCFEEAGLLDSIEPDVVAILDAMASAMRGDRHEGNMVTGRAGERLSFEYEQWRTGHQPEWTALESNTAGYDILSFTDIRKTRRLAVEVKASTAKFPESWIFVSRNEWETGKSSTHYEYHLWSLRGTPRLFVVPHDELARHAPSDHEAGIWQNVKIPMVDFEELEVDVPRDLIE